LCLGGYEVVATTDYCRDSKEPSVPGIIFAIDVSYPMIKEGVVALVCANMKKILKGLPVDPYCDKVSNRTIIAKYFFLSHFGTINFNGNIAFLFRPKCAWVS
jgi:protein transport protein SEC24